MHERKKVCNVCCGTPGHRLIGERCFCETPELVTRDELDARIDANLRGDLTEDDPSGLYYVGDYDA